MVVRWQGLSPEILDIVMSFSEETDAVKSALVCKNWKDVALDHAWHDMNVAGFMFLLQILAPLNEVPDPTPQAADSPAPVILQFSRPISHSDWDRLLPYARRVKVFDARTPPEDIDSNHVRVLSRTSLAVLLLTKPNNLPLLPQLRELDVGGAILDDLRFPWIPFFTHFLHTGLKKIVIEGPLKSPEVGTCFIEEVSRRAPNAKKFVMTDPGASLDATQSERISSFFRTMQKLSKVTISCRLLSPSLFLSLQNCKDLYSIHVYSDVKQFDPVSPFGRLPESVAPDAFSSLTYLRLQCSLVECNRLFANAVRMSPNLLHLEIDVLSSNDAGTFQRSLKNIANSFASLETLSFKREGDFSVIDGDAQTPCLTYEDLTPLVSLKKLRHFRLRYIEPVSIKNVELTTLLSRMHRLELLELNPDPIRLSPTPLTIDVLPMLARACPTLRELFLHVDEAKPIPPQQHFPFENLSKVGFGTSPLRELDKRDAMVFLSQVLPEGCKMDCLWRLDEEAMDAMDDAVWDRMETNQTGWEEVANLLPLLMDVRRETVKNACDTRKVLPQAT